MKEFLDLGLDGYFTDFPLTVRLRILRIIIVIIIIKIIIK